MILLMNKDRIQRALQLIETSRDSHILSALPRELSWANPNLDCEGGSQCPINQ